MNDKGRSIWWSNNLLDVKAHYLTDAWFVSFVSNNHCSALHQWVSRHVQPVVPYFPCPYCQVEKMGRYADDTNTLLQENIVFDLNFTCSCLMSLLNNEEENDQNSDAVQIRGDIFCCFFRFPAHRFKKPLSMLESLLYYVYFETTR